jgi:hypothetical protein
LVYRINFNQTGNYSIFTDEIGSTKTLLFGTNTSNFVSMPRTSVSDGFFPLANNKESAPVLFIPFKGINELNIWRGSTGGSVIKTIVLYKSDSNSPLILNDPSTLISSYDKFKTRFTISKPGISSINLLWKNSKNNDNLTVSQSVNFASVQLGNISSIHPSGLNFIYLTFLKVLYSMNLFLLLYSLIFCSLNTMDLFPFIVGLELKDLLQLKHLPILIVKLKVHQRMEELF